MVGTERRKDREQKVGKEESRRGERKVEREVPVMIWGIWGYLGEFLG